VIGVVASGSGILAGTAPPHGMERLIRNCLAKDPEERIQTAHDVKLQLQAIAEMAGIGALSAATSSPSVIAAAGSIGAASRARPASARLPWAIAGVAVAAAIAAIAWFAPRASAPAPPAARFVVRAPHGKTDVFWPRISPDGRSLLFLATDSSGAVRAFLRPLDQLEAHEIPGTAGLTRAYWSPDGKEIAFLADSKVQRVAVGGGSPFVICEAPGGADLSWSSKGMILMDATFTDSLRVVPAGGGELRPASRIYREDQEVGNAWPCFLPDGEHFLFVGTRGDGDASGNIRLGKLGSLESKLVGRSDGRVEYGGDGWILFVRANTLLAQKLDVGAAKLVGQPITITDDLRIGGAQGHFSLSPTGVLTFARDNGGGVLAIRAASRAGTFSGPNIGNGLVSNPQISPDGTKLLYLRGERALTFGGEVYVYDLIRATDTKITLTNGDAYTPQWSPDGRRIAYVTKNNGARLRIASADGLGGQDSIATPGDASPSLTQWAEAGSRLVGFTSQFTGFAVASDGPDRTVRPTPDATTRAAHPTISPDGRWLAYTSGSLPNIQIYVQSLEGPAGRWQVSTRPAAYPVWTKGGREIVYQEQNAGLVAVDIDTRTGFSAGTPKPLAPAVIPGFGVSNRSWAVDASGEKFFLVQRQQSAAPGHLEVVTRFKDLVTRK
jgi:Tol biopolymer transport system component